MGRNRLCQALLGFLSAAVLLFTVPCHGQPRNQLAELLKDADVINIYTAVAADQGKIVATFGNVVSPAGMERVPWLFIRTKSMGYGLYYFTTTQGNKVLVIFLDGRTTDTALMRLLK